jgi:hypothetical protein
MKYMRIIGRPGIPSACRLRTMSHAGFNHSPVSSTGRALRVALFRSVPHLSIINRSLVVNRTLFITLSTGKFPHLPPSFPVLRHSSNFLHPVFRRYSDGFATSSPWVPSGLSRSFDPAVPNLCSADHKESATISPRDTWINVCNGFF